MARLHLPHAIVVSIGGHYWGLSSSLSLSVEFSILDESVDAARSALQVAHYHVDVNLRKEGSKAYPTSVPKGQKEAAAVVVV